MKLNSLANRVTLLLALLIIVLLGAAAAAMNRMIDAELQRRFDANLLMQAHALAALVDVGNHGLKLEDNGRPLDDWPVSTRALNFVVRCNDGMRLSRGELTDLLSAQTWSGDEVGPGHLRTIEHGAKRYRVARIGFSPYENSAESTVGAAPAPCRFLLMQPSAALDEMLLEVDAILIAVPAIALLLVLTLSPWLVRHGLGPLTALRHHMRTIGPHEPGQRLPPSSIVEIAPLAERFNEVLARMDEGVQRERRFAGAVAHETRTHLAELRTLLDVELRHPSTRPTDAILGEISNISAELESTVAALLLLTRLEAGIETLDTTTVCPARLIETQLDALRPLARQRRLRIGFSNLRPDLRLSTDPDLLKLVIANLLSNAAAHAPEGDAIAVTASAEELCVRNHAPELEAADIRHLGQRHWQKSHTSDMHAGLGLSLAGAAARVLGLDLSFELDAAQVLEARLDWSDAVGLKADVRT